MKVVIVHDYLIDYGGAEKVLLSLHELYPKAPIYVSVLDKKRMGKFMDDFKNADIRQSWFGRLPFTSKFISPLRFLLPWIWGSFDFSDYDLIISSSSWAVTKGFKKGKKTIEISYTHTPPRYLYGYDMSRKWQEKWYKNLIKLYSLIVNHFMRMYDFDQAQKVDHFIVNSENVGKRVAKFYRREYEVIYPPVEVDKFMNDKIKPIEEDYFLTGGRLVAAKNFDLIIKACIKENIPLKIFGSGIDEERLRSFAKGKKVEFLGKLPDEKLIAYFKGAKAFIVAQKDEDFGMTLVESMAAGTPVIAYKGGGYVESVVEGETGLFFEELNVNSLAKTIKKFEKMKFNKKTLESHAKKFSKERFKREISEFVEEKVG